MDIQRIEKFILYDYIEPDVLWISSVWKVILFRGLRRSFVVVFVLLLAFFMFRVPNTEMRLDFFIKLFAFLIPVIVMVSIVYYRQIIVKGSEKVYIRHKKEMANKDENRKIGFRISLATVGALYSFMRFAPKTYSIVAPLMFFVFAIMMCALGVLVLFQICGRFYKIYLIKKYCPYLKTPDDARYYKNEDKTNNQEN